MPFIVLAKGYDSRDLLDTCRCTYKTQSILKTKRSGKFLLAGLVCDCKFFSIKNETVVCKIPINGKIPSVKSCIADNSVVPFYPNSKTNKFTENYQPKESSGGGNGAVVEE